MIEKRVTKFNLGDPAAARSDFVAGSAAYRLGLVWPLTREAFSLSGRYDVERRLQRHVTCVIRREG
jgi:hypothetical protein